MGEQIPRGETGQNALRSLRRAETAAATVEPTAPFTPATNRSKGLDSAREFIPMRFIPVLTFWNSSAIL